MSFTARFREEILETSLPTNAEKFAFVAAVLRIVGSIHINSNGINIEVDGERTLITKFVMEVKALYGDIEIDLNKYQRNNNGETFCKAKLGANYTERIADDTGFVTYIGGVPVGFSDGIAIELDTAEEIRAYLLGVVASCVSITVPQHKDSDENVYNGGYHLEMVFSSEKLAYDVMNYLAQFDIFVKKINRGDFYGLYIKDSNMISDFMAFFGGSVSVLEINNIMVARSISNDVNRQNNCLLANMDKTVEAGQKQYLAIKNIAEKVGLDTLSDKLRQVANIRLEYPSYSLDDMVNELGGTISKSGVNHRLRKLVEISDKLNGTEEKNG